MSARALGFVVHGLWPTTPTAPIPGLRPAAGLRAERGSGARREGLSDAGRWRSTNGANTEPAPGSTPQHYFRAVQFARDEFTIPDSLETPDRALHGRARRIAKQFIAANANLTADSMAVTCGRGELIDVRFCLTKDLRAFAICPKVAGHTCHAGSISVSPVR